MAKRIRINDSVYTTVDDDSPALSNRYSWYLLKSRSHSHPYVVCLIIGPPRRLVYIHRLVAGAHAGQTVHHMNRDTLDNRRENLLIVTQRQNMLARRAKCTSSSPLKGVSWNTKMRKWKAGIQVFDKHLHLGYFQHEEDAGRAYDAAAHKHFGPLARLNFDRVES